MNVLLKKLNGGAVTPQYQTAGSAGCDLEANLDAEIIIAPGAVFMMPTGLAVAIPEGYAGFVYARSGLATKGGVALANMVGIIDSDYRGELIIPLRNYGGQARTIEPGERIAQLIVAPVARCEFTECGELPDTVRGDGGFGSTGNT